MCGGGRGRDILFIGEKIGIFLAHQSQHICGHICGCKYQSVYDCFRWNDIYSSSIKYSIKKIKLN